jgi:hypothetical protein
MKKNKYYYSCKIKNPSKIILQKKYSKYLEEIIFLYDLRLFNRFNWGK